MPNNPTARDFSKYIYDYFKLAQLTHVSSRDKNALSTLNLKLDFLEEVENISEATIQMFEGEEGKDILVTLAKQKLRDARELRLPIEEKIREIEKEQSGRI